MDVDEEIEVLERVGGYNDREELLEDAVRAFLERRPELRRELAVDRYKSGDISLNRAAEIAGLSTEEFKTILKERGIKRKPGFLSKEERNRILKDQ